MRRPSRSDACCASATAVNQSTGFACLATWRWCIADVSIGSSNPDAARAPFGPLEAFWAYLQRQLRATGGIRRERLGLYLAAFAWRYNHRTVPPPEQVQELLELIRQTR